MEQPADSTDIPDERIRAIEAQFHDALLQARQTRSSIGQVEAAAAHYCRELRLRGFPPERVVRDAKRVIHDAIDGDDSIVAEHAVRSCIQHYFRDDE